MTTLVVDDYDKAIAFFVTGLGFHLVCDEPVTPTKRWVVVRAGGGDLLLAKAANERQSARVGDQTGGRVGFFLYSDDFARDRARIEAAGGRLLETPRE
ncbi:MAG: VOC family protein, partial [Pseudomonadota bacterium]